MPTIWIENTSLVPPVGTPARANSSARITCSSAVSPGPAVLRRPRRREVVVVAERVAPLRRERLRLLAGRARRSPSSPAAGARRGTPAPSPGTPRPRPDRWDPCGRGYWSVALRPGGRARAPAGRRRRRRSAGLRRRGRPGRIAAPRANSMRARAVELLPGRRRRSRRRSRAPRSRRRRRAAGRAAPPTDATARPTRRPARRRSSSGASAAGAPGARRDGRAAAPPPPGSPARRTRTARPSGTDDHVADVAGVAVLAVEEATVEDDAAADAGGHDHRDVVALAPGGAAPALAEREGLGVVVDVDGQAERLRQAARAAGSRASPGC